MQAPDAGSGPRSFCSFEDLEVYRPARESRKALYEVARQLPVCEKYGLAGQIRRAAVSLTNNLAEGHGRFHFLDQIGFTLTARGSLEELIDDLNVCLDEKYLAAERVAELKSSAWQVLRLLNGYLRYLRDSRAGGSLQLHELPPTWPAGEVDEVTPWLEELLERHAAFFAGPQC